MPIKLEPPPYTPPPPQPGGLGERLVNGFLYVIRTAITNTADLLASIIGRGVEVLLDLIGDGLRPITDPIFNRILATEELPDDMRRVIEGLRGGRGQWQAIILPIFVYGVIQSVISAATAPLMRRIEYAADKYAQSGRVGAGDAARALVRGIVDEGYLRNVLTDAGMGDDELVIYKDAVRNYATVSELLEFFYRGAIGEGELADYLRKIGYSDDDVARMLQVKLRVPQLQDVIRFAVRECYNPELRAVLDLDAEYPSLLTEKAKNVGLDEENARNYWAAHWELPSLSAAFEMYHRIDRDTGQPIISRDVLESLIKAQDYAPTWRDKLLAISYSPFTRVDTRRMAKLGIIDRQEVYNTYRDLGYDDFHAQKLTDFVYAENQAENRDLAKSDVLDGYARGVFSREQAKSFLTGIGYDSDEADFYLDRVDYLEEKERIQDELDIIHKQYVAGMMDENTMVASLGRLNLPESAERKYMNAWRIERSRKEQRPSVSQLQAFLKQDVISEEQFRREMDKLGYNAEYTEWFLREIKPEFTASQVIALYRAKAIDEAEFRSRMLALGYSEDDVELYVEQLKPVPTLSQLQQFLRKAIITEQEFRSELARRGYSPEWIEKFTQLTKPAPK